jgi:hypothetical protein
MSLKSLVGQSKKIYFDSSFLPISIAKNVFPLVVVDFRGYKAEESEVYQN